MSDIDDPQRRDLVRLAARRLRSGARRDDVIRAVAERGKLEWGAAQEFVGAVEARYGRSIGSGQRSLGLLLSTLAIGGTLALGAIALVAIVVRALEPQDLSADPARPSPFWAMLAIIFGILTFAAAVCDWYYFFEHPRARPFVAMLGRRGARSFYSITGILMFALGVAAILA